MSTADEEYDYEYDDLLDDGSYIKRRILADFDASDSGAYVVQAWGSYGFEDVRTFTSEALALAYAARKSVEKERRYRALGPEEA